MLALVQFRPQGRGEGGHRGRRQSKHRFLHSVSNLLPEVWVQNVKNVADVLLWKTQRFTTASHFIALYTVSYGPHSLSEKAGLVLLLQFYDCWGDLTRITQLINAGIRFQIFFVQGSFLENVLYLWFSYISLGLCTKPQNLDSLLLPFWFPPSSYRSVSQEQELSIAGGPDWGQSHQQKCLSFSFPLFLDQCNPDPCWYRPQLLQHS